MMKPGKTALFLLPCLPALSLWSHAEPTGTPRSLHPPLKQKVAHAYFAAGISGSWNNAGKPFQYETIGGDLPVACTLFFNHLGLDFSQGHSLKVGAVLRGRIYPQSSLFTQGGLGGCLFYQNRLFECLFNPMIQYLVPNSFDLSFRFPRLPLFLSYLHGVIHPQAFYSDKAKGKNANGLPIHPFSLSPVIPLGQKGFLRGIINLSRETLINQAMPSFEITLGLQISSENNPSLLLGLLPNRFLSSSGAHPNPTHKTTAPPSAAPGANVNKQNSTAPGAAVPTSTSVAPGPNVHKQNSTAQGASVPTSTSVAPGPNGPNVNKQNSAAQAPSITKQPRASDPTPPITASNSGLKGNQPGTDAGAGRQVPLPAPAYGQKPPSTAPAEVKEARRFSQTSEGIAMEDGIRQACKNAEKLRRHIDESMAKSNRIAGLGASPSNPQFDRPSFKSAKDRNQATETGLTGPTEERGKTKPKFEKKSKIEKQIESNPAYASQGSNSKVSGQRNPTPYAITQVAPGQHEKRNQNSGAEGAGASRPTGSNTHPIQKRPTGWKEPIEEARKELKEHPERRDKFNTEKSVAEFEKKQFTEQIRQCYRDKFNPDKFVAALEKKQFTEQIRQCYEEDRELARKIEARKRGYLQGKQGPQGKASVLTHTEGNPSKEATYQTHSYQPNCESHQAPTSPDKHKNGTQSYRPLQNFPPTGAVSSSHVPIPRVEGRSGQGERMMWMQATPPIENPGGTKAQSPPPWFFQPGNERQAEITRGPMNNSCPDVSPEVDFLGQEPLGPTSFANVQNNAINEIVRALEEKERDQRWEAFRQQEYQDRRTNPGV